MTTRISTPNPTPHAAALERALRPLIRRVRATIPKVSTPQDAAALGRALKAAFSDAAIRALVTKAGVAVERDGSRPWERLGRVRGDSVWGDAEYDGDALVDAWTREATGLITSVRAEVAEQMSAELKAALAAGTPAEVLQRRWIRRGIPVKWGTLEGRAKVIAHHQIARLAARVQATRAEAVGVTEFTWVTRGDSAVRPSHRKLNGRVFPYRGGAPGIGLPGDEVGCRCRGESVIPDDLLG